MRAVLMAGGVGERLRPITYTVPKPLVPIGDKPCIEYVLKSLVTAGFHEIIMTVGYLYDKIIDSIGDGNQYGAGILYSVEDKQLGTAGSVKNVERFLEHTFAVASGDVFAKLDIARLYSFHKERGAKVTIALTKVSSPSEYGIMELRDGRVIKYKEKPKGNEIFSNLVNAGFYMLEPEVLAYVPRGENFDFSKHLFPILLEEDVPVYGCEIRGKWRDIGRPKDLLRANIDLGTNIGRIKRGENVEIKNSTIADGVELEDNSVVEKSLVMKGCKVGEYVLVKNSILCANCRVGSGVKIIRSVIGENVEVQEDKVKKKVKRR